MEKIKAEYYLLLVSILVIIFTAPLSAQDWKTYPYQQEGSVINFPKDEGWHPNESSEWWYTVAHVTGDSTGTEYSFMLTYFYHPAYGFDGFRIFNLANDDTGEFYPETMPCKYVKLEQNYLNIKAAIIDGRQEQWTTLKEESGDLIPFEYHLSASSANGAIDVNYNTIKRPLMVGGTGFLYQGKSGYTYYYSQTMLEVTGSITFDGVTEPITGKAWIDRQYGQFNPSEGENYEWFCVQLSNGMDFNLWNIFTDANQIPDTSTYQICSIYINDSTNLNTSDFEFMRQKYISMPDSTMCYAQQWQFRYENIDLTITTINNNNEVKLPFRFYEGSTIITGTVDDKPVTGVGFAELLHSYSPPKINISSPSGHGNQEEPKPFVWQLLNPDDGRPIYYDLELSSDNKATFNKIARGISDTTYNWDTSEVAGGIEYWLRIVGYSVDSTLSGVAISDTSFVINPTSVDNELFSAPIISTSPNPFSQFSTINYELTIPGNVVVKVYDVMGNEVAELVNEYQDKGAQSCLFDAEGRSDGLYFYTIRTGDKIESGKMMLVR